MKSLRLLIAFADFKENLKNILSLQRDSLHSIANCDENSKKVRKKQIMRPHRIIFRAPYEGFLEWLKKILGINMIQILISSTQ